MPGTCCASSTPLRNDATLNVDSLSVSPLIKGAIRDAIMKALAAQPVKVHIASQETSFKFFNVDGEVYSEASAIDKIMGEYSWWET